MQKELEGGGGGRGGSALVKDHGHWLSDRGLVHGWGADCDPVQHVLHQRGKISFIVMSCHCNYQCTCISQVTHKMLHPCNKSQPAKPAMSKQPWQTWHNSMTCPH